MSARTIVGIEAIVHLSRGESKAAETAVVSDAEGSVSREEFVRAHGDGAPAVEVDLDTQSLHRTSNAVNTKINRGGSYSVSGITKSGSYLTM